MKQIILLIILTAVASGCSTQGALPYEPRNSNEQKFYELANKNILPDDVRKNPLKYKDSLIAWVGIVEDFKYRLGTTSQIAVVTLKHHYFDWIEDHGKQKEIFFLSPRGEGKFAMAWVEDVSTDLNDFKNKFAIGNMIIVYGYPSQIKNSIIGIAPIKSMHSFPKSTYRTDIADYGRPSEPVRQLNRPF